MNFVILVFVKSAMTDVSTKLVCVYNFTQVVPLCRSNRPIPRHLCVPVSVP
jgi:hypothetical protein